MEIKKPFACNTFLYNKKKQELQEELTISFPQEEFQFLHNYQYRDEKIWEYVFYRVVS